MTVLLTILGAWYVALLVAAITTDRLSVKEWAHQAFLVVDQAANVLLIPFHSGSWADETLSARAWRAYRDDKPWGRATKPVIDALFFWQDDHCYHAHLAELARRHSPPEDRP